MDKIDGRKNKGFPVITIFKGKIITVNKKRECPHYSRNRGTCSDGQYKFCNPPKCNRLHGKIKYSEREYTGKEKARFSISNKRIELQHLHGQRFYDWLEKELIR